MPCLMCRGLLYNGHLGDLLHDLRGQAQLSVLANYGLPQEYTQLLLHHLLAEHERLFEGQS